MDESDPPNSTPNPINEDDERPPREISVRSEKRESQHEMFQEEYVLPLGFVRQGLREVAFDRSLTRCAADSFLIFFFSIILLLINPVASMFEIQNGVMQALGEASIDAATYQSKRTFTTIQNNEEFWAWAGSVLYQKAYNSSVGAYGSSSAYSIASYNRIVTPIRFRQLRMKSEDCQASKHELKAPCWPTSYSSDATYKVAPGSSATYTSFESDSLSRLFGTQEDQTTDYGTSGHVVDLELDSALAWQKLDAMMKDRWTDEWTRIVAVDVNTYNANYDIATVFRFKVERMIGGELAPRIETCSCRLNPYSTASDYVRMVLEGIWAIGFLVYTGITLFRIFRTGLRQNIQKLWTWAQLIYVVLNIVIIITWFVNAMKDRDDFKKRNATEFKDLNEFCSSFRAMGTMAALSIVFGCLQLFNGMRLLPGFSLLWKAFAQSVKTTLQFSLVVLLAVAFFSFGAMWRFGARIPQLSRWYSAFGIFVHSLITSKDHFSVYDDMRDVNSTIASFLTIVWILTSCLIFINMCISILTVSFLLSSKRKSHEEDLEHFFPLATVSTYLQSKVHCLWKDPDTLEPVHRLLHTQYVWTPHLHGIDLDALGVKVDALVDRKEFLFKVSDAMEFFPHCSEEESYWQAVSWMRSLGRALGGKMTVPGKNRDSFSARDTLQEMGSVATKVKPKTTSFEITMATQSISQLEEEILGLGLQLRKIVPIGAPKARYV